MRGSKHGFLWDTDVYFDNSNYRLSIVLRGPAHPCRLTAYNVERTELKSDFTTVAPGLLCVVGAGGQCASLLASRSPTCATCLPQPTSCLVGLGPCFPHVALEGRGPSCTGLSGHPAPCSPHPRHTQHSPGPYLCGSSDQEDSQGCSVDCLLTEVLLPTSPLPTPHPPPWASVLEPAG